MASGTDMTAPDGGTIAAIIGAALGGLAALAGGIAAVVKALGSSARLRTRVVALETEIKTEKAARAALEDQIGQRVADEVRQALAQLPAHVPAPVELSPEDIRKAVAPEVARQLKNKAQTLRTTTGSGPSVEEVRKTIADEVERVVRESDTEQARELRAFGQRIDALYGEILKLAITRAP